MKCPLCGDSGVAMFTRYLCLNKSCSNFFKSEVEEALDKFEEEWRSRKIIRDITLDGVVYYIKWYKTSGEPLSEQTAEIYKAELTGPRCCATLPYKVVKKLGFTINTGYVCTMKKHHRGRNHTAHCGALTHRKQDFLVIWEAIKRR